MCDRQRWLTNLILSASSSTAHKEIVIAHHVQALLAPRRLAVYHLLIILLMTLAAVRNALEFQQSKKRKVRPHYGPAHQTQETIIDISRDNS